MQYEATMTDTMTQTCQILSEIFGHIQSVQEEIAKLNLEAMEQINDFIFTKDLEVDDATFVALQHQDILRQQLGAVGELAQTLQKHLDAKSDPEVLESKFAAALEIARAKKEAYRGNAF